MRLFRSVRHGLKDGLNDGLKDGSVWDWRLKEHRRTSRLCSISFGTAGKVTGTGFGHDPREAMSGSR